MPPSEILLLLTLLTIFLSLRAGGMLEKGVQRTNMVSIDSWYFDICKAKKSILVTQFIKFGIFYKVLLM